MKRAILERLAFLIFALVLISILTFIIIELPPGDYADRFASVQEQAGATMTADEVDALREQLGLNKPWYERYWKWIRNILLHGNFGLSYRYRRPVTDVIGERIGYTSIMLVLSLLFTYGLAIPLGIFAATRQYSVGDYALTILGYIGLAAPNFLLALIIAYINVVHLGTSVGGLFSAEYLRAAWSWGRVVDLLKHIWVPAVVLGTAGTAWTIRVMRATLLDEKNKLYVTAARAKGLPEWKLLLKYPVRVALNPIVSTIGWQLTGIISGAPIVSLVLALPDTGQLYLEAVLDQDMYLAGCILLIYVFLVMLGTFISDILLSLLDPRVK